MSEAYKFMSQVIMVSATITPDVERVSREFMTDPKRVKAPVISRYAEEPKRLPERLKHTVFVSKSSSQEFKLLKLVNLLQALTKKRRPLGELERKDVTTLLVFINDPSMISDMVFKLRRDHKINVRGLGARSTREQYSKILEELAAGQLDILVATDFLARGMDMYGVTDVVNFDLPRSGNMYLHRAGRAGRMKGKFSHQSHIVTFCNAETEEKRMVGEMLKAFDEKPRRVWISGPKLIYGD